MTILCATTERLPGIRPCTHRGQHRVTCLDHEGWAASIRPGECGGCLPRSADRGYLCQWCYEKVDVAYIRWNDFARLVRETEGRAVTADNGGIASSTPDGYTNLPLTVLALDECERLLRSQAGRTLDAWVHTEDGARDAIMFAHAAERAYRSLEVETPRATLIVREECPNCEQISIRGNLTRERGASTIINCEWCGHQLGKIRTAPAARADSKSCEQHEHLACCELACQCECHDLGRRSTAQGIAVLWDADQFAMGWVNRDAWVFDGRTVHRVEHERKTA